MATRNEKLVISLESSILFFIINHSFFYNITNNILLDKTYNKKKECRTKIGIIFHAILFCIITYLTMWNSINSEIMKIKNSLYATLLFFFVASPAFTKFLSVVFKGAVSKYECQTLTGLVLSTIVYGGFLFGLMHLPN